MNQLIYTALVSLDGYIEDPDGEFDWAMPDEEVHAAANEIEDGVGTHLYGRGMYETMAVWQTLDDEPDAPDVVVSFADSWRSKDKVVFSRTLEDVWTPRTRLVREFDVEEARDLVSSAGHDVSIAGPGIATRAFGAGLVDAVHLFVFPVLVGGGKSGLPADVRAELELVSARRFDSGVVHLHHRTR